MAYYPKFLRRLLVHILLLFPLAAQAHLISIHATKPFPSTVYAYSSTTATFTVTNITSKAIIVPINQSQFPKESGLSVISSHLGKQLGPGQSCTIKLKLEPTSAQTISTALKVVDGVQYPIHVTVLSPESHDVIVIGAGIAGMEAATVLQKNKMDVLILEAQNRTGGRIQTTTMQGAYIDFGATWLHDVDNNELAFLAKKRGVKLIDTPLAQGGLSIYDHGTPIDPSVADTLAAYYPGLFLLLLNRTYASCGTFADAVDCYVQHVIPPVADYSLYSLCL